MSRRTNLTASAGLLALIVGFVEPMTLPAQGRDAVYRSLRLGTPLARQFMEPQGLQDAAYDLLTADMNIMSSTYVDVLSASVTTGEAGDAVAVHVTGQFGVMRSLYVVDPGSPDELWRISDPSDPGAATSVGSFPSGLGDPRGIASHGGALYVVDPGSPDELWRISDPSDPGAATSVGSFPIRPR